MTSEYQPPESTRNMAPAAQGEIWVGGGPKSPPTEWSCGGTWARLWSSCLINPTEKQAGEGYLCPWHRTHADLWGVTERKAIGATPWHSDTDPTEKNCNCPTDFSGTTIRSVWSDWTGLLWGCSALHILPALLRLLRLSHENCLGVPSTVWHGKSGWTLSAWCLGIPVPGPGG